jgi:hypothetical protein
LYCENNKELLVMEAAEERRRLEQQGISIEPKAARRQKPTILSGQAEINIGKRQRKALNRIIESITFDRPMNADRLDKDLAEITDQRLNSAARNIKRRRRA